VIALNDVERERNAAVAQVISASRHGPPKFQLVPLVPDVFIDGIISSVSRFESLIVPAGN